MDVTMFTDLCDPAASFPNALSHALARIDGHLLRFEDHGAVTGYEIMFAHASVWVSIVDRDPDQSTWVLSEPQVTPVAAGVAAILFVLRHEGATGFIVPVAAAIAAGRRIEQPGPVQLALGDADVRGHPRFDGPDELAGWLRHHSQHTAA